MLAMDKDGTVASSGSWSNGTWTWNLSWRRALRVWEEEQEQQLVAGIDSIKLREGILDNWIWIYNGDGIYKVSEVVSLLKHKDVILDKDLYKVLWNSLHQPKYQIVDGE